MKKKLVCCLLAATMVTGMFAAAGQVYAAEEETAEEETAEEATDEEAAEEEGADEDGGPVIDDASGMTIAIVVKSAGNPYNEKEAGGFQSVIEELGGTCIVNYPEAATADAQVSVIQSLISQGVDAIAISANDENALQAALEDAMEAGIKVLSLDSGVNPESRMVHVNQAGTALIGESLMEAVYDISGGEGQYAILSATSQATNQNSWIEAMAEVADSDSKYDNLELVEIAYGDDESQKSTDQTQALLDKYPDLKVICSPTTVGINAAAKVLQDKGSSVKLTGLGLPSEMEAYIGDSDEYPCPYMYLWNPIDLGELSAYVAVGLVDGSITGTPGEVFTAGGDSYGVVEAADGGTEIILGPPFKFDSSNIEEWAAIY